MYGSSWDIAVKLPEGHIGLLALQLSVNEGGERSSRKEPTPGRQQTQGELSSVLQVDKCVEPCVAQGNLPQLQPFPEPKPK